MIGFPDHFIGFVLPLTFFFFLPGLSSNILQGSAQVSHPLRSHLCPLCSAWLSAHLLHAHSSQIFLLLWLMIAHQDRAHHLCTFHAWGTGQGLIIFVASMLRVPRLGLIIFVPSLDEVAHLKAFQQQKACFQKMKTCFFKAKF